MQKRYCPTVGTPEVGNHDERFTYRADTRVRGICASLKEDVLDLQREDQMELQKARFVARPLCTRLGIGSINVIQTAVESQ